MTNRAPATRETLGGFESRLLDELRMLVERGSERTAPMTTVRSRSRPLFALVLAVVGATAAILASSIGAWRLVAGDAHKQAIATKLQKGGHLDRLVATSGKWSLYVQPSAGRLVDWELSSRDEDAVGGFLGNRTIEVAGLDRGPFVGRVEAPGAASVVIVGRDGRTFSARLHGAFFLAVPAGKLAPAAVVARDKAGRTVARVSVRFP